MTLSRFLLMPALAAICLFSACAKQEGDTRTTALDIFGITEKSPETNVKEIVFANEINWERENLLPEAEIETVAFDGSQITTIKDKYGNITHQRNFRNHPRIKSLIIIKSENSEPTIYLYGRDGGSVVRMNGEIAEKGLDLPADELADRADLRQAIDKNPFSTPKIPSSLPVKNAAIAPDPAETDSGVFDSEYPQTASDGSQDPQEKKTEKSQITKNNSQKSNPEDEED